MTDDKVYRPETIAEAPFPGQSDGESYSMSQSTSSGELGTQKINSQKMPEKRVAVELLSSALNTKSKKVLGVFELAQSGGFRIGNYLEGESGQIDITPNGIVARDIAGVLSFVLDALTGDATFKGTIQAGSLISQQVIVGNNSIVLDGDPDNPVIIFYQDEIPSIVLGNVE